MPPFPGPVILFGSGETSPSGRKVFDRILRRLPPRPHVSILETPAGFQPNSAAVAGQIAAFFAKHLRNYQPRTVVVPARKRNSEFSPDDPIIAGMLRAADLIFLGPGSPTYAVRHLRQSITWQMLQMRHRAGAAIAFASAATIAASSTALPVYEIYKVGEELHWQQGLDFFAPFGLDLTFVPHWNNQEGGADLDTSCCFIGRARFEGLLSLLPNQTTVVGIDEHTALILDLVAGVGLVEGTGSVTFVNGGEQATLASGADFALTKLGPFHFPSDLDLDLPPPMLTAMTTSSSEKPALPSLVAGIVAEREVARQLRDWARADALRAEIMSLGWEIHDTPTGPQVAPAPDKEGEDSGDPGQL